jgi:hypothetical protein
MKNLIFLLALPLVLIFSCSSAKEELDETVNMLTLGPWTVTLNYEDEDLDGVFEEFGDDCEKDDRWEFYTNNTLRQDLGPVLCDPDDDPNFFIAADWELQNNQQDLIIKYGFDDIRFRIVSLTSNEMVLNIIDSANPSGVFTHRVVLQR